MAGRVERDRRLAVGVDRQHFRRGERVRADLTLDLVDDRIGVRRPVCSRGLPQLVAFIAERVLLTVARPWGIGPGLVVQFRNWPQRHRDEQLVAERIDDQRAGRERLFVDRVGQGDRRRVEGSVGRDQAPAA